MCLHIGFLPSVFLQYTYYRFRPKRLMSQGPTMEQSTHQMYLCDCIVVWVLSKTTLHVMSNLKGNFRWSE